MIRDGGGYRICVLVMRSRERANWTSATNGLPDGTSGVAERERKVLPDLVADDRDPEGLALVLVFGGVGEAELSAGGRSEKSTNAVSS